jgi:hypothetical protein
MKNKEKEDEDNEAHSHIEHSNPQDKYERMIQFQKDKETVKNNKQDKEDKE